MAIVRVPEEQRVLVEAPEVTSFLAGQGIDYERWTPAHPLTDAAPAAEVLEAYGAEIDRLKARGGYVTADVIDVSPDTPGLDAMLAKFSREHWHDEDEVRFILEGAGVFHIHPRTGPVFAIEVAKGDLIRVPRGTWHWFDLCADRRIRAIRLFQEAAGWTPQYTESGVDRGFEPVCLGAGPGVRARVSKGPAAFLLDIEGTTTPLDFVTRVLFPYAHERVAEYLSAHFQEEETRQDVQGLCAEHARDEAAGRTPPPWADTPAAVTAYARWLIEDDRKLTALKALQGRIWEEGFRGGQLRGVVYEDVPRALARWQRAGLTVAIFSSGSVLAQKLLFAHSNAGDLTPFLAAYFDTTTGPKREARSYQSIANALGKDPREVWFVSDVAAELDAARAAGLETALCVRDGAGPGDSRHPVIRSFDELALQAPSPTNL